MGTVVADDWTIINTQGVRFVERLVYTSRGEPDSHYLRVTYKGRGKGAVLQFRYPTAAARDAQYDALRAALAAPTRVEMTDLTGEFEIPPGSDAPRARAYTPPKKER